MKSLSTQYQDLTTMNGIIELSYAFQKSKVLLTACELDVFSVLGNESKTAKEVAHEIDADERATERLLNALCALTLVSKKGDRFANSRGARWYLVKESPEYLGNMMHLTDLWNVTGTLTDAVKLGKTVGYIDFEETDVEKIERRMASLHWNAKRQAPGIIDLINLTKVNKILDLGGGSGAYSIEFLKSNPELEITLYDKSQVIPITKKYIENSGYEGKINLKSGDFFDDDLGSNYDIVFVSSIMHNFSLWDNIELAQKIWKSLRIGGQIIVHDLFLSDDRTEPVFTALYSLNMLISSISGEIYTKTDMWITLKEAWYRDVRSIDTPFETTLTLGTK
jgi:ubiquinone/menaquinone biosynthesis C-methylase UbiE